MRKITVTLKVMATPSELAKKYNTTVTEIKKRIAQGMKYEHEHSKNKKVAEKIAIDHLLEKFDYYKNFKG